MIREPYFQSPARRLSFSGEITYLTGALLPFSGEQALSFSISEGAGEGMLLGGAFSASFSLSLYDGDGCFTFPHSPQGAQVRLFLDGDGEKSPLGVFTVARVVRDEHSKRLTLSGMDALGTAFSGAFSDSFSYPLSLQELARGIASQGGFSLGGEIPNGDILIASPPAWGDISLRQALGYAAEAAGCFASISREGALRFTPAWPEGISCEIGPEALLKREYGETVFGPLDGITVQWHQASRDADPLMIPADGTLLNDQNCLKISKNPLFSENSAHSIALAQGVWNQLRGMRLSQGKIFWRGNPSLLLGQRVRILDGNGREMQITGQTLSFSQGFSMQSDCRAKGMQSSVGRLFTSSGALNAAMLSGEIDGALIRDGSVAAHSLLAGSITALQLAADAVTADQLAARSVTAQKLAAHAVEAEHLSADALSAVDAHIEHAEIGWAEIDELTAVIANIATGKIQNADIDFAHIKDLAADTAIITKGVGGELYISRLAVTEANMVSLSVGQLLVKGQDGGFYAVTVDESGNIKTEKKQVGNGDVANLSINAGEKLIEGSVTAATLNAKDIFADSAIIRSLIAANLDVDTLFAREATIAKLNAVDISGNEYLRLSVKKAVDSLEIGGRNLLTKRPTISTHLSSNITRTDYGFTIAPVDQDTFLNITTHEDIIQGEEYTLSMECEGFSEGEEWTFYIFNQWGMDFTLKNGKVSYTFQSPGNMGKSIVLDDKTREKMPSGTVTVKNLKLERGNKATDWTPAPEDIEERVSQAEAEIAVQAGEIAMKVSKGESVETLKNSAMTLNGEGIEMTTDGHFRLYANDGKNSRIKLGGDNETANFSVDETGALGAVSGDFAQGLSVGNYPVWTKQNIIISSNEPTGVHDVLWIQPLQGVQQASHSCVNTSQTHFTGGNAISYSLSPETSDVLSSGGNYSYSLSLRMTLGEDTTTVKTFTVSAVLSTSAGSVTLSGVAVSLSGWKTTQITLTGTSSVNLCAAKNNITAAVKVSGGSGSNTYMYIPRNTSLILTSKNTSASSAGAQTCTIHYIQ